MQTENVSTLKIHKLTQAQYDRELANGNIDETALYLTPDEGVDIASLTVNGTAYDGSEDVTITTDPIITTGGNGAAYTATVDSISSLTAGVSFTMIPHTVSTSTTPTLNVNSLGAKQIRRMLSTSTGTAVAGSTTSWLTATRPIRVTYNGVYWIAGTVRPSATDLYGTLPIASGGTGAASADDARTNLGAMADVPATTSDYGKVLAVNSNGAPQWEQRNMIVTITYSSGTASADKTYTEILQAFNAGIPVVALYDNALMPLNYFNGSTYLMFGGISYNFDDQMWELNGVTITSGNAVYIGYADYVP